MEKSRAVLTAVCDAGPLIHLDELDSLDLLADFRVWVPNAAWQEVEKPINKSGELSPHGYQVPGD